MLDSRGCLRLFGIRRSHRLTECTRLQPHTSCCCCEAYTAISGLMRSDCVLQGGLLQQVRPLHTFLEFSAAPNDRPADEILQCTGVMGGSQSMDALAPSSLSGYQRHGPASAALFMASGPGEAGLEEWIIATL